MLSKENDCLALLLVVDEKSTTESLEEKWRGTESKVFEVECKVSTVLCGHSEFLFQQDKLLPDDTRIGSGPHLATLHRISGTK